MYIDFRDLGELVIVPTVVARSRVIDVRVIGRIYHLETLHGVLPAVDELGYRLARNQELNATLIKLFFQSVLMRGGVSLVLGCSAGHL